MVFQVCLIFSGSAEVRTSAARFLICSQPHLLQLQYYRHLSDQTRADVILSERMKALMLWGVDNILGSPCTYA